MLNQDNRFIRHASIISAVLVTMVYLIYRGLFTLNLDGIYASFASVSLYLAEIYGCFLMFLYFFQIWELVEPEPVPPLEGRTIDVFIPTYNEDPELLRGTISAAVALDYPHETYVLDDGNRAPVEELAAELGAIYINRPSNLHAKAGNLNHAMEITDGEFVVIFDADHVSRQDFITRLLGYFEDDQLGFVQTPHSFYNFDNFHGMLNYEKQTYWEEGELFYNVIQPGKNYWNGVSFCGSAAMFRRSALVDVGLVATETITEDMHTGLRMHAKGWKSLFVNERLVSGQAATDVSTFNTQRLRWGEGNLGIFAFDNPLTIPGLTIPQRICYLGSMLSWTTGLQKLQLYIAPMLMLLTGVAPVDELSWTLGIITIVYMIVIWTAVTLTSNGHGHLVGTELTHMAAFWTQVQSCYRAVFKRNQTKFVVTAKRGRQTNSIRRFITPQCLYIVGSAVAIAWASTMFVIGLNQDLCGLVLGSTLLLIQCWFAWQVIRRALREKDGNAEAWRYPCALNVSYEYQDSQCVMHRGSGVTCDINEIGIGFHAFENIPQDAKVTVKLSAIGISTTCQIELVHKEQTLDSRSRRDGNASSWRYGAKFVAPSTESLAVIWRLCSDYATARLYDQFESHKKRQRPNSIESIVSTSEFSDRRLHLPLTLRNRDGVNWQTTTEGLSALGCMVLLKESPKVGENLRIQLATPLGTVKGTVIVTAVRPVVLGCNKHEMTEVEFEKLEEESRSLLLSICNSTADEKLAAVVSLRPPERQLPHFRPAVLSGSLAVAASALAIISTLTIKQDDWLLSSTAQSKFASAEVRVRLTKLLDSTLKDSNADEGRLIRLREIFQNLNDIDHLANLDEVLMAREVVTFPAKLCRAQTFDAAKRFDEAFLIYRQLLERVGEPSHADKLNDLYVSAGRNYANRHQFMNAAAMFSNVDQEQFHDDAVLRREYAGLLAAADQADDAIALLQRFPHDDPPDRMMLASIYAADQRFTDAIEQCRAMLIDSPGHEVALHLMADCALGQSDFETAASTLQKICRLYPSDRSARIKLAQVALWGKHSAEAIGMLEPLLQGDIQDRNLQQSFVESTLLVDSLTRSQLTLLNQIVVLNPPAMDQESMTQLLVNAMVKFRQTDALLPLLTNLVQRHPDQVVPRLQLVDLLEARGDYQQAESHLRILMSATDKSARTVPAEASRLEENGSTLVSKRQRSRD